MKISNSIKTALLALSFLGTAMWASAQSTTQNVWIEADNDFVADGTTVTRLVFSQHDDNQDYIAFNVNIIVPKGLTVNKIKSGRNMVSDVTKSDRLDEGHSVQLSEHSIEGDDEHTLIKVSCVSFNNVQIYNTDWDDQPLDWLISIGFKADGNMAVGTADVKLADCKFVHADDVWQSTATYGEFHSTTINVVKPMTIDYTLTSVGVGTLIVPFDCEIPAGLVISACPAVGDDNVVAQVTCDAIKANTPYLVEGTPGNYSFTGNVGVIDVDKTYTEGVLVGVMKTMQPPVGSYVLQNHDGHVAFYRYTEENTVQIGAYRCYLQLPPALSPQRVNIGGLATRIHGIPSDSTPVDVYNIQGIQLRSQIPAYKALEGLADGVYVINGTKTIKTTKR